MPKRADLPIGSGYTTTPARPSGAADTATPAPYSITVSGLGISAAVRVTLLIVQLLEVPAVVVPLRLMVAVLLLFLLLRINRIRNVLRDRSHDS